MKLVRRFVACDACGALAYPDEEGDGFDDGQGCVEPGCGGIYRSEPSAIEADKEA